jgi:hypothetical protein
VQATSRAAYFRRAWIAESPNNGFASLGAHVAESLQPGPPAERLGKRLKHTNMKRTAFGSLVGLVVACTLIFFAGAAVAQTTAPGGLLTQAYDALAKADRDYKGHRVEAMKQIKAAAKELGVTIHDKGKGHEKQVVSDDQLREAEKLLQQAEPDLSGKPLRHVKKALHDLSVALTIK